MFSWKFGFFKFSMGSTEFDFRGIAHIDIGPPDEGNFVWDAHPEQCVVFKKLSLINLVPYAKWQLCWITVN